MTKRPPCRPSEGASKTCGSAGSGWASLYSTTSADAAAAALRRRGSHGHHHEHHHRRAAERFIAHRSDSTPDDARLCLLYFRTFPAFRFSKNSTELQGRTHEKCVVVRCVSRVDSRHWLFVRKHIHAPHSHSADRIIARRPAEVRRARRHRPFTGAWGSSSIAGLPIGNCADLEVGDLRTIGNLGRRNGDGDLRRRREGHRKFDRHDHRQWHDEFNGDWNDCRRRHSVRLRSIRCGHAPEQRLDET